MTSTRAQVLAFDRPAFPTPRTHPRLWRWILGCWLAIIALHVTRNVVLFWPSAPNDWLPGSGALWYAVGDAVNDGVLWFLTCLAGYATPWLIPWKTSRRVGFVAQLVAWTVVLVGFRTALIKAVEQLTPLPGISDWPSFVAYAVPGQLFMVAVSIAGGYAYHYFETLHRADLRAAELRTEIVAIRLSVLEAQIHPHFLFNALHSVSSLMTRDVPAALEVLSRLTFLLRTAFDASEEQTIPLGREVELVRTYLEVERVRYGDRLESTVALSPDAADLLVPALILLPLVENAVRHGVAPVNRRVVVSISAHPDGAGRLRLEVEDDGAGYTPRRPSETGGIGLSNTRARLTHLYGQDHEFSIRRGDGGGTDVVIVVPRHPGPQPRSNGG
jgi:signal transduction histidine kinase